MKITKLELLPVECQLKEPLRWGSMEISTKGGVLVRVHTDEGITGVGEAGFSNGFYPMIAPIIRNILEPLLVGKDLCLIEKRWDEMFKATHKWGRRGLETYAISGIDIALWDILGKISHQPVYKLLGGHNTIVRAYAAPSLKEPSRIAKECEEAITRGFTAIKLRVGLGQKKDAEIVQMARKAVGESIDIMVDANMAYDFRTSVGMAKRFEQYNILWLEEPILSRSLEEYCSEHGRLREAINIRLAGAESLFTRYEFVPVFTRRVFDIVQPDCTGVGGITEGNKVAAMASSFGITCIPHIACSSGTGISLAANLQIVCSTAKSPFVEYDHYDSSLQQELSLEPIQAKNGYVKISDKPGLGVELNEDALKKYRMK
ncbi:mandelate racemase/muconate lactonizing enzyme family protein [Candidatus Aerophobetes bacterium]|nr:mandelate racemase/muconate lactonizing enzyme family protein [Candidatus Aerophobetes bacterium]